MKKVRLLHYDERIKGKKIIYSLHFDQDVKFEFTSKRALGEFNNQVNKFFTKSVTNVNYKLVEIYSLFRHYYFTLDSFDTRECQQLINDIESHIARVIGQPDSPNQRVFVYYSLIHSIKDSLSILKTLRSEAKSNSDTSTVYRIEAMHTDLQHLQKDIQEFKTELVNNDLEHKTYKVKLKISA